MQKNFHLKTPRLELVPQGMEFLETTHAYASDRETMKYMRFLPNDSLEESKLFLRDAENEWKKETPQFYECAVLHQGEHIGGVSLYLREEKNSAELAWCLKKDAHGNAYAQEAAAALARWAHKELGINHFVAHCDSENNASWKTMEKLGMQRVSCTGGRFNKATPEEERREFLYEMNVKDKWRMLSRFDKKNIPQVMEVVLPLWSPPSDDKDFIRLDVEFIVRNNIYEPELSFQLTDMNRDPDNELLSAAFFTRRSDRNTARQWLSEASKAARPEQLRTLQMVSDYLAYMDAKTLSFMHDDDIKLSLFVSRKRGAGSALLAQVLPKMHAKGYKQVYLWTDSDCNWKWYINHGYELLSEEVYAPFSTKEEDYRTFVFRKALS